MIEHPNHQHLQRAQYSRTQQLLKRVGDIWETLDMMKSVHEAERFVPIYDKLKDLFEDAPEIRVCDNPECHDADHQWCLYGIDLD